MRKTSRSTLKTGAGLGALVAVSAALAGAAEAQERREFPSQTGPITATIVAGGLEQPWAVEALPDGAYIVTELPGRLRIVRDGVVSPSIRGLPDIARQGQGGLLDVALDPAFSSNRTIYVTMSVEGDAGLGTAVVRGVLSADETSLTDVREIFRMNKFSTRGQHFGSRIAFAADGTLFFGIGDRGDRDRAQDMRDHAGALMRINTDGTIPADNPYADGSQALPEIWSKGHRNPQGIAFDPADGKLYTAEHGARGGDEVNVPLAGSNYGWPVITYGKDYSGADIGVGTAAEGYEQPITYWDPSIAPGAMDVYRGAMFPEWDGNLLVAALKYQLLVRIERDDTGAVTSEERLFDGEFGRLRDVKVAPDGSVLMVTDEADGQLIRLSKEPTQ